MRGEKNTIVAQTGLLMSDESRQALTLRLSRGSVHSFQRDHSYHRTDFGTFDIILDLNAALASVARERDASEMSLPELYEALPAGDSTAAIRAVELQRRFSIPFACLAFAAVAVPLGLRPSNSVRSRGFIISLALILAYYLLLTLGQSLAERGAAPTAPAMWLPNVLLLLLAGVLFRRVAREPAAQPLLQPGSWSRFLQARLSTRS
jgi:lipopolysaccharide export system permease protein